MMLLCFVLWLNNTSAFVGHFKLSPKEREKLGMEEIVKEKKKRGEKDGKENNSGKAEELKTGPSFPLATSTNDLNTF